MNITNSKNMFFIILLFVILVVTFSYALLFNHDTDIIYTDVRQAGMRD